MTWDQVTSVDAPAAPVDCVSYQGARWAADLGVGWPLREATGTAFEECAKKTEDGEFEKNSTPAITAIKDWSW